MELVDTHCHLQFEKLADNVGQVIEGAAAAGVKRLICVGTSLEDSQETVELAARYDNVWAAVGAHPHGAHRIQDWAHRGVGDSADFLAELNRLASKPKVVAIGEIGLDYYKDYSPREAQIEILRAQIEVGLAASLPFIFHVRDAFADFWPIFDEYEIKRGVVHSFSAGPKILDQVLSRGLYVGLNGIMTFTRDAPQLEAARTVPLERLLVETDAPFLTPNPHRGEVCEPKHVRDTAEFLAGLRGEGLAELAAATSANAERLFGLKNE